MLYAKVTVGLPVAGPFDYAVEPLLARKIRPGCRVWVPWRSQKKIGYVVGLSKKTNIRKVKPVTSVIDGFPVLDKYMLSLTKKLSDYYCCSWGQAIEASLPPALRKGKTLPFSPAGINSTSGNSGAKQVNLLIHDLEGQARWDIYIKEIKETLSRNQSVILLFPDKRAVLKAAEIINSRVKANLAVLHSDDPGALQEWLKIKEGKADIVIGRRSGIFAPLDNLGLVIIDQEHNPAYKQDQVPHYHPREVALMRVKIQKARLILASTSVSLESFYLAKKSKLKYLRIERRKNYPELKISDIRHIPEYQRRSGNAVLSKYLQDLIALSLEAKEKILLFLNRKGFATFASCVSCGASLKCPRCSVNLVYYFKDSLLKCHYCNFKLEPPKICPHCNAGYIKYSGVGTEKIESELARIYPQARIKLLDKQKCADIQDADIFISSEGGLGETDCNFGFIGILFIDNSLNRVDFRAGEKTFQALNNILRLTDKKAVIQTRLAGHYIFTALVNRRFELFYENELVQRKQLKFPPYQHLGLIKIRGRNEDRVQGVAAALFQKLKQESSGKNVNIVSVNCAQPAKLRGNFYWQILARSASAVNLSRFLKIYLKDLRHSGIIVTVDIDPI